MSKELLIQSLRQPIQTTLSHNAHDFQKRNNVLVEVIKMMCSGDFASIKHYISNVYHGKTGVEGLQHALNRPDSGWTNEKNQWERVEFQFEGSKYYLCDLNLCKGKYEIPDNADGSLGLVQVDADASGGMTYSLITTDFSGSLYSLALAQKSHSQAQQMSSPIKFDMNGLVENEADLMNYKYGQLTLEEINGTYLLQIDDFLFIKNGEFIQIEDRLTAKCHPASEKGAKLFKNLVALVDANQPIRGLDFSDLQTEALNCAKLTILDELFIMFGEIDLATATQMNRNLILIYTIYNEFINSIINKKDNRDSSERANWCVDYLRKHPQHLQVLKQIFPIEKLGKKTVEDKCQRYMASCQNALQGTCDNPRKMTMYSYLISALSTFMDALNSIEQKQNLIKQKQNDEYEVALGWGAAFDYQPYPLWFS